MVHSYLLQALDASINAAINTDKGNISDPVEEGSPAESKYSPDDSPDRDGMDQVKSSEAIENQQDTDNQIQQTLEHDDEIHEDHSASSTERNEVLSEEIAVAGMKTDTVPDPIGWV